GLKMTYGSDDADSDDEYGDLHGVLYDVTTRLATATNLPAGFQSFQAAGHDSYYASDGKGQSNTPELLQFNGNTGGALTTSTFSNSTGIARVTHPDWSRDGTMVYFTSATTVTSTGYSLKDDLHVTHGSIWSAQVTSG